MELRQDSEETFGQLIELVPFSDAFIPRVLRLSWRRHQVDACPVAAGDLFRSLPWRPGCRCPGPFAPGLRLSRDDTFRCRLRLSGWERGRPLL